jgi:DNA-binding NtrC family response regulator
MEENILVVENEPNIREAFDLVFGESCELHMACSAEEALATPPEAAEAVRVIFLDGDLGPGLSGDQALPFFLERFPRASIVYIGALGPLKAPALKAAGVSIVLPKPWLHAPLTQLRAAAAEGFSLGRSRP